MENLEKNYELKKQDTGLATLLHLSIMAKYIFPFMGIIAPLIIWKTRNQEDQFIEENAKSVINFQISTFIYGVVLVAIAMIFFGGTILNYIQLAANDNINEDFIPIGIITTTIISIIIFAFWSIAEFVLIIIGALKASNGMVYNYPFTLKILK
jgi:uncharacterized Tic20 family protein